MRSKGSSSEALAAASSGSTSVWRSSETGKELTGAYLSLVIAMPLIGIQASDFDAEIRRVDELVKGSRIGDEIVDRYKVPYVRIR